ncbi:uncharacterized protein MYCGRDRAFT_106675 [Zymoseptoria tritici IPO323]|uniref:Uncharacterized protein n=1 Tax=Zymoseptoria tritici (strain CBS 115943 / IPO323) TaxID=336722 RepID=F9XRU1_ZYMTI|nr:uncharacterized protein MYCGRDRAFT_106675 [Zymoseptoria tritici IPO323]EGP82037.1 hypothetical protein MYCGRDRAFT_106675 [Zymoseptoria tritici IPO323]
MVQRIDSHDDPRLAMSDPRCDERLATRYARRTRASKESFRSRIVRGAQSSLTKQQDPE